MSSEDYIYRNNGYGDMHECECCGAEAPTRSYPCERGTEKSEQRKNRDWHFCQICDSMSMSIHVQYNTSHARGQLEKPASVPEIAKLLNLAIDVITGRKENG